MKESGSMADQVLIPGVLEACCLKGARLHKSEDAHAESL